MEKIYFYIIFNIISEIWVPIKQSLPCHFIRIFSFRDKIISSLPLRSRSQKRKKKLSLLPAAVEEPWQIMKRKAFPCGNPALQREHFRRCFKCRSTTGTASALPASASDNRAYAAVSQANSALQMMAVLQVFLAKLFHNMDESRQESNTFKELCTATHLALQATKATAQAVSKTMANLVVLECHLWIDLTEIKDAEKMAFLDSSFFCFNQSLSQSCGPWTTPHLF